MTINAPDTERREAEAADWYARLSRTPIETEELTRFQRWCRDENNLKAYNDIDDISRAVRRLRDDPAMRAAAQQALARPPERSSKRRSGNWRALGAGLAFAAVIGAAAVALKTLAPDTYSTRVGEISSVRLADGSQVRLNTDSKLRVRFSSGQRRVELVRGQAFFEVAHDTTRPFIVSAGPAEVRAVGTQFDVRKSGVEVRVVLAQGRVAISDKAVSAKGWTLTPGQGLVLGRGSSAPRPLSVDVDAVTSWRTGRLTFHDITLAEAVEELNRYGVNKIVLDASAPRQLVINGAFEAGDISEFVSAAALLYGLKSRQLPNGDIELSAQPAAS